MFRNYLIIALRQLRKQKVFSFINILGLSLGITCCVLLALFIKDELSYEKHYEGHENIYRITSTLVINNGSNKLPTSSPPIATTMLQEFPELENAVRVVSPLGVDQHLLQYKEDTFYEKRGYLVDSTFFDIFPYAFKEGDPATALDGPSSMVLSYNTARKIFGDRSALNELIAVTSGNSSDTFRVTGVLKPYTEKSQLDADLYMCMNSRGWGEFVRHNNMWSGQNFVFGFIKVRPDASIKDLEAKFPALLEKYGAEQLKELGIQKTLGLQRLTDIHLYSAGEFTSAFGRFELGASGNITYLYILGSICFFILLIACINFMNLTTAKAAQRAGEVGIRKSLGANRASLIRQFLGESLAIVVLAMVVSVVMVQVTLPIFNQFTQKDLAIDWTNASYVVLALVVISLFTGVIAGSYPAFFLSGFQPARVLKGKQLAGGKDWLRRGLVVFQFVISITLISAILIIQQQMRYIQDKTLGFNPEYRITLPLRTSEAKEAYTELKSRLKELSGVREVSAASAMPASPTFNDMPIYTEGSNMENAHLHYNINVDENFFSLLHVDLVAGRDLRFELDTFNFGDAGHVLVNRASLDVNNIPLEEAVGSRLYFDWEGRQHTLQIVGVVEDYHQFSLHREVAPLIFLIRPGSGQYNEVCASLEGRDYDNTLAMIRQVWKEVVPNTPFEHALLSDNVKRQYEADQRVFSIISTFTVIAIFISCLGLYGLSIFVAERKVKEIGIRKVLGASVTGIIGMLSKDFLRMIAVAFLISIPIGYYAMEKWLEGFVYRIDVSVAVFFIAGVTSFLIAWITIGFESVRAAVSNPVDALKVE